MASLVVKIKCVLYCKVLKIIIRENHVIISFDFYYHSARNHLNFRQNRKNISL